MKKTGLTDGASSETEQDQEETKTPGGRDRMLRLPYAIAKDRGIDTTGMTPSQVWDKLKGLGVSPQKEMTDLADKAGWNEDDRPDEKDTSNSSGSIADSLYSSDSRVHTDKERTESFRQIGESKVARVTSDYILDCVDGKILTKEDLKMLAVRSGNQREIGRNVTTCYIRSKGLDNSAIVFNARGAVPTDDKIALSRAIRQDENYCFTVDYRLPEAKRFKATVDHEVAHFLDRKFSVGANYYQLKQEVKAKKQEVDDIWKDVQRFDNVIGDIRARFTGADGEVNWDAMYQDPEYIKEKKFKDDSLDRWRRAKEQVHVVERNLEAEERAGRQPSHVIKDQMNQRGVTREQIQKEMSHYAAYDAGELFAEGFSCIKNIPKEQHTPTMRIFAEEFDKYFKGRV